MSNEQSSGPIQLVPVDEIFVLNPRDRNQRAFDTIVENIKTIGLKKPIVVTPRHAPHDGPEKYTLVCGEGRLKAFRILGEAVIPALVVEASDEEAYLMSLTENMARRKAYSLDLLSGIQDLQERGYTPVQIAQKTGLVLRYVEGVVVLLRQGEQRLLMAVERGSVPLTAALHIAAAGDDSGAVQAALQEAYEAGALRGRRLIQARMVIERRASQGRAVIRGRNPRSSTPVTTSQLLRVCQKEVDRQRLLVRKATFTQQRLLFIVTALKQLFGDEHFVTLLRAEGLDTLPRFLADKVWS